MPTATHRRNLEIAAADFATLKTELATWLESDLADLAAALEAAGAPWTPGRALPPN
jgi:hypothetical protein